MCVFIALKGHSFYSKAIYSARGHPVAIVYFNSNRPTVWVEKSKIGFNSGHFEFPIGMILAIFHLHINLLLHCKFQLNLPCGLREDVCCYIVSFNLIRLVVCEKMSVATL